MSREVELLRRAASLMRERAREATPGPWQSSAMGDEFCVEQPDDIGGHLVAETSECAAHTDCRRGDAEHIASWYPAVALAVADWLDREAQRADPGSHAVTVREIRENHWSYDCPTCGVSGSAGRAGVARWQEAHAAGSQVADPAVLTIARRFLREASDAP